jgi:hypothetical protein
MSDICVLQSEFILVLLQHQGLVKGWRRSVIAVRIFDLCHLITILLRQLFPQPWGRFFHLPSYMQRTLSFSWHLVHLICQDPDYTVFSPLEIIVLSLGACRNLSICSNVQISSTKFFIWNECGSDVEELLLILSLKCFSSKSFWICSNLPFSASRWNFGKNWAKDMVRFAFCDSLSHTNAEGNMTSLSGSVA